MLKKDNIKISFDPDPVWRKTKFGAGKDKEGKALAKIIIRKGITIIEIDGKKYKMKGNFIVEMQNFMVQKNAKKKTVKRKNAKENILKFYNSCKEWQTS